MAGVHPSKKWSTKKNAPTPPRHSGGRASAELQTAAFRIALHTLMIHDDTSSMMHMSSYIVDDSFAFCMVLANCYDLVMYVNILNYFEHTAMHVRQF